MGMKWISANENCVGMLARFCDVPSPNEDWEYGVFLGMCEGGFVCEHCGGEQEVFNVAEVQHTAEHYRKALVALAEIDQTLRVDAAEYVPAIRDVFTIIDRLNQSNREGSKGS